MNSIGDHSLLVLDFGGQYSHLIANRIRRCGAYSVIVSNTITSEEVRRINPSGIILSGGPASVNASGAPDIDPELLELGIPILGICYGHQLLAKHLGGEIISATTQEFGKAKINTFLSDTPEIMKNIPSDAVMWMNHGDEVSVVPNGFEVLASSKDCAVAVMGDTDCHRYGVQFHPEVTHSEYGMMFLENFVRITGAENTWSLGSFIEQEIQKIQYQCEGKKVFLLVSGGVDSSVCFALLTKALGKDRVFGCLVDHGMMRKNEAKSVQVMLEKAGFLDLHTEHCSSDFLDRLQGITAPEEKRRVIGEAFLDVQSRIADRMNLNPEEWILGQGTIYPDTIESGGSEHASKIKTHHNRVEKIEIMIAEGKIIEPIADLYKDEVRLVGKELGLSDELIERHPFPGPGLGVRVLCTEGADVLSDTPLREDKISTRFPDFIPRVLPIRSVGVQGDARSYRHPVVLFPRDTEFSFSAQYSMLLQMATQISNTDPDLNRVLISVGSKTSFDQNFVVDPSYMTPERIGVLQNADAIVREELLNYNNDCLHIWQFPVVLAPVSCAHGKESIILRPIESENAMTATSALLPPRVLKNIITRIESECENIDFIFYDLTGKPPGTIEWE